MFQLLCLERAQEFFYVVLNAQLIVKTYLKLISSLTLSFSNPSFLDQHLSQFRSVTHAVSLASAVQIDFDFVTVNNSLNAPYFFIFSFFSSVCFH